MNKREAGAVLEVLDWLTSLEAFELHPDCGVDDAALVDAVDILATRAHRALGAEPTPRMVREAMYRLLGVGLPPRPEPDVIGDDVAPNAGSAG